MGDVLHGSLHGRRTQQDVGLGLPLRGFAQQVDQLTHLVDGAGDGGRAQGLPYQVRVPTALRERCRQCGDLVERAAGGHRVLQGVQGAALTSLEAGASGGAQPSAGRAAGVVVSFI
ncbi:hypothetical protein [Streptomyces mirabilis]|uniref:hypothetical protein n=1 Tax=Streptomyces mirabilis TaxID=68239 RepID=UPI00116088B6|nr:hypothetical protein [Streptomyces mirabilis]